jgi:hypothetical protein
MEKLAQATPLGVYRTSGSAPRLPTSITLLTLAISSSPFCKGLGKKTNPIGLYGIFHSICKDRKSKAFISKELNDPSFLTIFSQDLIDTQPETWFSKNQIFLLTYIPHCGTFCGTMWHINQAFLNIFFGEDREQQGIRGHPKETEQDAEADGANARDFG